MNNIKLLKLPQSAFVLKVGTSGVFAFDLGSEVTPDMLGSLGRITALFTSHRHPDHLHIENVRLAATRTYGPPDVVADLQAQGISSTVIHIGDTVDLDAISVTAYSSDHGPNISAAIDNVAFVVRAGTKSVYFLGDMAVAPLSVPHGPFDAVLIPVGGSKVFTPEDAVRFVQTLGPVKLIIPMHYHGRADRQAGHKFKELLGESRQVTVMDVGEEVEL